MPMPRPRYTGGNQNKKKDQGVGGLSFLHRLLYVGVTFGAVWAGVQIGIPLLTQYLGNMNANMQLTTAKGFLAPDPSWTLESSVENKAGVSCDDKVVPCPNRVNRYTSTKPVTVKQMKALTIMGTIQGTCEPMGKGNTVHICDSTGNLSLEKYESYVLDADANGKYTIVVTVHADPVTPKKQ